MRASSISHAILQLLEGQHTHLTAAQIYDALKTDFSAVNPSTVYRALKRLVSAGEVSISDMGMESLVYERRSDIPHHHLVCQGCGQITMIGDSDFREFIVRIENTYPYKIVTEHLILYGICARCQQKQEKPPI